MQNTVFLKDEEKRIEYVYANAYNAEYFGADAHHVEEKLLYSLYYIFSTKTVELFTFHALTFKIMNCTWT